MCLNTEQGLSVGTQSSGLNPTGHNLGRAAQNSTFKPEAKPALAWELSPTGQHLSYREVTELGPGTGNPHCIHRTSRECR